MSTPIAAAREGRLKAEAGLARRYLAGRRQRDAVGPSLFLNPAWDMLLDLFAASVEGGAVSISSACIASNCPISTAHLWVGKLEEAGLVRRLPDVHDRRRTFLEITPVAVDAIERWLVAVFQG